MPSFLPGDEVTVQTPPDRKGRPHSTPQSSTPPTPISTLLPRTPDSDACSTPDDFDSPGPGRSALTPGSTDTAQVGRMRSTLQDMLDLDWADLMGTEGQKDFASPSAFGSPGVCRSPHEPGYRDEAPPIIAEEMLDFFLQDGACTALFSFISRLPQGVSVEGA